jgi:hypothetical protein
MGFVDPGHTNQGRRAAEACLVDEYRPLRAGRDRSEGEGALVAADGDSWLFIPVGHFGRLLASDAARGCRYGRQILNQVPASIP